VEHHFDANTFSFFDKGENSDTHLVCVALLNFIRRVYTHRKMVEIVLW
jgi:hypothetical protein